MTPRPEIELLVRCVRAPSAARADERVRSLLRQPIDWDFLIALAARHRVRPLFWAALSTVADALPEDSRLRLESYSYANAARNLVLTSQLVDTLALLEAEGIRALAFKGPVLAARAYGNVALREFVDLDILLPRADIRTCRDLFLSRGFRLSGRDRRLLDGPYPRAGRDYVFYPSSVREEPVEVHCEVAPWFLAVPFETEALLERSVEVPVATTCLRTLSSEDEVLVLVVHAMSHGWATLEAVCAVSELTKNTPGPDWNAVWCEAGRLGIRRFVHIAMRLAEDLLGTPPPAPLRALMGDDRSAGRLARAAGRRIFSEKDALARDLLNAWFHFRSQERLGTRARFCARMVPYQILNVLPWDRIVTRRYSS